MARLEATAFRLPKRRELTTPFTTKITLDRSLLHTGESLHVRIVCEQANRPPDRLSIFMHYLKLLYKSQTDISLQWQKITTGWETEIRFSPPNVGNYLLKFSNGMRDPMNPYSRYFAVIDENSIVCNIRHLLDTPLANYDPIYHRYFIPADYELIFDAVQGKIERHPQWTGHKIYRYYQQKFGDAVFPRLNLKAVTLGGERIPTTELDWSHLSASEIAPGLNRIFDLWEQDFGYRRPQILGLDSLNPPIAAAAAACGVLAISSSTPEQALEPADEPDPTRGMPLFPYFMSAADFRVPQRTDASVVAVTTTVHPFLNHEYHQYQLSPAVAQKAGYASHQNLKPLLVLLEQLIRNRDPKTPQFLTLELAGHFVPEIVTMNFSMLQQVLRYARRERLVFASKLAIAQYFRQNFTKNPERTCCLTDMYQDTSAALHFAANNRQKPPHAPDMLYFENEAGRYCFCKPESKPFYAYQFADFIPDRQPEPVDFSAVKLQLSVDEQPTLRYQLKFYTTRAWPQFPIAIWDLPGNFEEVKTTFQHNCDRFIPVTDQVHHALHAIVLVNLQAGLNEFYLDFGAKSRKSLTPPAVQANQRRRKWRRK
ncbi:hypothetical protein L0128_08440 [candidate division KSB1 bacterium]|nr:hypothetical protein [candidate division KSB1 bacterium]